MTVLINKWDGEQFENNNCCTNCGSLSATKNILFMGYEIRFCKGCLLSMVDEIDQAILKNKNPEELYGTTVF